MLYKPGQIYLDKPLCKNLQNIERKKKKTLKLTLRKFPLNICDVIEIYRFKSIKSNTIKAQMCIFEVYFPLV